MSVCTLLCPGDSFISRTGGVYLGWHQPVTRRRVDLRSEKCKEVSEVCVQFLTKVGKIVWAVNWDPNKILTIQFINPFSISGIVASQTRRPFKSLFYVVEIYSSTEEGSPEVSLCLSRTIPSNSPEPTLAV